MSIKNLQASASSEMGLQVFITTSGFLGRGWGSQAGTLACVAGPFLTEPSSPRAGLEFVNKLHSWALSFCCANEVYLKIIPTHLSLFLSLKACTWS